MHSVYTTINNNLTKVIFTYLLTKDYHLCVYNLFECHLNYDDNTFKRVFEFCWCHGIKYYYKTLRALIKNNLVGFDILEQKRLLDSIKLVNKCIQLYKSKGGVLNEKSIHVA